MGSFIQNAILQTLREGQERRTLNAQLQQRQAEAQKQQEQFDVQKELELKRLESQQAEHDRTYQLNKARADFENTKNQIDILEAKGKIGKGIENNELIIPGITTIPSGFSNNGGGFPQQTVELPNGLGTITTLTPEGARNKKAQETNIAHEVAQAFKRSDLEMEEDVKQPGRIAVEAAKATQATGLEILRQDGREKLARLHGRIAADAKVKSDLTGKQNDYEQYKPFIDGLIDGGTTVEEMKKLPEGKQILSLATEMGIVPITAAQKPRINTAVQMGELIKEIDSSMELRPSTTMQGLKNTISPGFVFSANNPQLAASLASIGQKASEMARFRGDNRITDLDSKLAIGDLNKATVNIQEAISSRNKLVKSAKSVLEGEIKGLPDAQKQVIRDQSGLYQLPETYVTPGKSLATPFAKYAPGVKK